MDYPPLPDFLHAESEPVRYSKDEDGPQGEPNMNTLLRRSYELPDVAGDRWTDQYKPTVIGTAPCRVAAEAMLSGIEWDSVFHDEGPGDPLERLGTLSVLQGDAYISRRDENTLIAWVASRLHRVDMCMTDGHEDEDFGRYFNDCWGDDGESDHEWESWWAVDADPEEFWAFVQQVVRR